MTTGSSEEERLIMEDFTKVISVLSLLMTYIINRSARSFTTSFTYHPPLSTFGPEDVKEVRNEPREQPTDRGSVPSR